MTKELNITIDGMEIKVPEGTTIMQAADQLNIHIPRLCYHPHLSKVGACRVCLVEIEGMKKPVTSCNYAVADGMKIKTQTAKLRQLR
ncbi:MAG TPA: 2Fe-2S iron-sulfur cluster-binding protein, partial [Planctomycetota bacterium]|nr:2Fe-2S iron-sulfur cluster-binding protein [Planctomycetota bacterium]